MQKHKYLMDTHIWIWWNARPEALSLKTREIIANSSSQNSLLISAISFWELSNFIASEDLILSRSPESWMAEALDMPGLQVVNLTPEISLNATVHPCNLLANSVSQILASTARTEDAILLTQNQELHKNKHIQTLC